jgi:hypothetical protein
MTKKLMSVNEIKNKAAREMVKTVFEYHAKEAIMEQFKIEFDNLKPDRPAWLKPEDWQTLHNDTTAEMKRLLWRVVPKGYQLGLHDLMLYRPPPEVSPETFALSDPKHVPTA